MGRPSSYKPEYCQQLIDHMTEGLSFESFAGVVSVQRSTVYNWLDLFEDFSDAKKEGEMKCLLFWEKLGIAIARGDVKGNTGAYVFNKKNRFGWRDTHEVEHTQKQPFQFAYSTRADDDE